MRHSFMFGDTKLVDDGGQGDWANPYGGGGTSSPPLVSATPDTNSSSTGNIVGSIIGGGLSLTKGLVNIFGQPAQPQVAQAQPPPLWLFAALGVGGIAVVAVLARGLRQRRRSTAGYRRRHRR